MLAGLLAVGCPCSLGRGARPAERPAEAGTLFRIPLPPHTAVPHVLYSVKVRLISPLRPPACPHLPRPPRSGRRRQLAPPPPPLLPPPARPRPRSPPPCSEDLPEFVESPSGNGPLPSRVRVYLLPLPLSTSVYLGPRPRVPLCLSVCCRSCRVSMWFFSLNVLKLSLPW
jgi:hypothetical protein